MRATGSARATRTPHVLSTIFDFAIVFRSCRVIGRTGAARDRLESGACEGRGVPGADALAYWRHRADTLQARVPVARLAAFTAALISADVTLFRR